jgi:hypothetical protein
MKKFALVVALVLLAAVPVSAAEISQDAPATTALQQQVQGTIPLFAGIIKQPTPYCSTLQGTSCPSAGATTACTDVCNNQLSCTCYNVYAPPYYITVIGHYWYCDYEC